MISITDKPPFGGEIRKREGLPKEALKSKVVDHPDVYHLRYAEFSADPVGEIAKFYRRYDFQFDAGGDPFVGAKLGNLLLAGGFEDVSTTIKTFHYDNREPARRKQMIAFWEELLLSAADQLVAAGKVPPEVVDGVRGEMRQVQNDPDAVFFFSFVQARATVY